MQISYVIVPFARTDIPISIRLDRVFVSIYLATSKTPPVLNTLRTKLSLYLCIATPLSRVQSSLAKLSKKKKRQYTAWAYVHDQYLR